jgi:hypothetical protein
MLNAAEKTAAVPAELFGVLMLPMHIAGCDQLLEQEIRKY